MGIMYKMEEAKLVGYKDGVKNQLNEAESERLYIRFFKVAIYRKNTTYVNESGMKYDLTKLTGICLEEPVMDGCNEVNIELNNERYLIKNVKSNRRFFILELEEVV